MADGNKRYKSDKKVYKVSFKLSETELLNVNFLIFSHSKSTFSPL